MPGFLWPLHTVLGLSPMHFASHVPLLSRVIYRTYISKWHTYSIYACELAMLSGSISKIYAAGSFKLDVTSETSSSVECECVCLYDTLCVGSPTVVCWFFAYYLHSLADRLVHYTIGPGCQGQNPAFKKRKRQPREEHVCSILEVEPLVCCKISTGYLRK